MADDDRDVELVHPNRDKPEVKATRAAVVLILLVSVGLMLVVTLGGWSYLEGLKPLLILWEIVYLVLAFYAARWYRGTLPMAAALGIVLLILAAIAGPQWFDRDHSGFANPALPSSFLGVITLVLVPVQFLQIAFSMRGFQQDWHVEVERPRGERGRPQPAAA